MFMGYIIFSFFFLFFFSLFIHSEKDAVGEVSRVRFLLDGYGYYCYATLRRYASMEVRMDLLVGVMLMTAYRLPDLT